MFHVGRTLKVLAFGFFFTACSVTNRPAPQTQSASMASVLEQSAFYAKEKAPLFIQSNAVNAEATSQTNGETGNIPDPGGNGNGNDGGTIGQGPGNNGGNPTNPTPTPTVSNPPDNGGGENGGGNNPPTTNPTANPTPVPTANPTNNPGTGDGGTVGGGETPGNGDNGNIPGGGNNGEGGNVCQETPVPVTVPTTPVDLVVSRVCTWHYEPNFFTNAQRPIFTIETFPTYDEGVQNACVTSTAHAPRRPIYAMTNDITGDYMNSTDPYEASPSYRSRGLAFFLYTDQTVCNVPVYRCYNGYHYLTNQSCDQGGNREGLMGYACSTQREGTSALNRMRNGSGAFFVTNDARDYSEHTGWGWYFSASLGYAPTDTNAQSGILLAYRDLTGYDFSNGRFQGTVNVDLSALRSTFPQSWQSHPIRARLCDDRLNLRTCNDSNHYTTLSLADLYMLPNHLPTQINLETFSAQIGYNSNYYNNLPESCDRLVSPLVLNLKGEPIQLSGAVGGVMFDLTGIGETVATGWTAGADDVFLVRDTDGDGRITNGRELFGSATLMGDGTNAKNGFEALRDLDSNHDGFFTPEDDEWESVMVWRDRNHNALTEAGELLSLDEVGITSINLSYSDISEVDRFGNKTLQRSSFKQRRNGVEREGLIIDVWFKTFNSY